MKKILATGISTVEKPVQKFDTISLNRVSKDKLEACRKIIREKYWNKQPVEIKQLIVNLRDDLSETQVIDEKVVRSNNLFQEFPLIDLENNMCGGLLGEPQVNAVVDAVLKNILLQVSQKNNVTPEQVDFNANVFYRIYKCKPGVQNGGVGWHYDTPTSSEMDMKVRLVTVLLLDCPVGLETTLFLKEHPHLMAEQTMDEILTKPEESVCDEQFQYKAGVPILFDNEFNVHAAPFSNKSTFEIEKEVLVFHFNFTIKKVTQ